MQVLLRKSQIHPNLHCNVCGQGFRLYWEPGAPAERVTMRNILLGELRDHHAPDQSGDLTSAAHPADLFRLPALPSAMPSPAQSATQSATQPTIKPAALAFPSHSSRSNPPAHNVVLISRAK